MQFRLPETFSTSHSTLRLQLKLLEHSKQRPRFNNLFYKNVAKVHVWQCHWSHVNRQNTAKLLAAEASPYTSFES